MKRQRAWRWVARSCLFVGMSAGLGACSGRVADDRRSVAAEFARLDEQLRRVQAADNPEKARALAGLRGESCERLCEFRSTCLSAFERHVAAFDEVRRVRARLEKDEPSVDDLAQEAARAARALDEAQPLIAECVTQQGALGREHR